MNIEQVQRIARAINLIRPDWPVPSLETFIRRHEHMAPVDLHLQLVYVAHDPKTTTPARIDQHGPWKYLLTGPREQTVAYRYTDPRDCGICNKPEAECRQDGHDYTPAFVRHDNRATPEQRAAVKAAAQQLARPLPVIETTTERNQS